LKKKSLPISLAKARAIWLGAQKLDVTAPFGSGPEATKLAVEHLGYVQIDTINVIERSHHHILFTRIPTYTRKDLEDAQSVDKSVFEYWTHALAYVPSADYRYFIPAMRQHRKQPNAWFGSVGKKDFASLLRRIRDEGPLSIRDIDDDVLVEKDHPWASRKPSKRAMQFGFYTGDLTISKRTGMLKTYDLTDRHFGWERPKPATEGQYAKYLLDRAVRSQGIISMDSACYGDLKWKARVSALCDGAVRKKQLVPAHIEGFEQIPHWVAPEILECASEKHAPDIVHILSPFDPLVIQRKRLNMLFGHDHRFEAYVPAEKRILGYFALPVLVGDEIVAAVDLKMDRKAGKLLMQKWTWLTEERAGWKALIEAELGRFETFQTG
jgi:uncharacterized protein YcaQ